MEIGLLLNSNGRLCSNSEKWREILVSNKIPCIRIDPNSITLLDDMKQCSHLMFQHTQGDTDMLIYDALFNIAHNVFQIKCFPDFQTYWPYENKIKEYYLLKSHNLPVNDSKIFWNYENAYAHLKEAKLPVIVKLPKGAGSSNVIMINTLKDGKRIIGQVFNKGVKVHSLKNSSNLASVSKLGTYKFMKKWLKSQLMETGLMEDKSDYPEWQIQKDAIIFQRFLPCNTFDTRVTVIGNRALAFRRFVRKNDFRASGSNILDFDHNKIDRRCVEISFEVSERLNFSTMAYDFIFDEKHNPLINEISYSFDDSILTKCPGYWDNELIWHSEQNWPQYYQLSDFLNINDLKKI